MFGGVFEIVANRVILIPSVKFYLSIILQDKSKSKKSTGTFQPCPLSGAGKGKFKYFISFESPVFR